MKKRTAKTPTRPAKNTVTTTPRRSQIPTRRQRMAEHRREIREWIRSDD